MRVATFTAFIFAAAIAVAAVGETAGDLEEAVTTIPSELVQEEALPSAAVSTLKHKMRAMVKQEKLSMHNQEKQAQLAMKKKTHAMARAANLRIKEVHQKTKKIKLSAKKEGKKWAKKAVKAQKKARKLVKMAAKKAKKAKKAAKKALKKTMKKIQAKAKAATTPTTLVEVNAQSQSQWSLGDMTAAVGGGREAHGAKAMLRRLDEEDSELNARSEIQSAFVSVKPPHLALKGISRRRAPARHAKKKAVKRKAKRNFKWGGYSWDNAYITRGGHYHLGPSRRRIGAGFGRRRRTNRTGGKSIASGENHMLSNRYTGLKNKKQGQYACSYCVKTFLDERGCSYILYKGKRAKDLLPPECSQCTEQASKLCHLKKKKHHTEESRRRRRRASSDPRKYIDAAGASAVQCNKIMIRATTGGKFHAETRHQPKVTLIGSKGSFSGTLNTAGKSGIAITNFNTGHIGALTQIRLEATSRDGWYFRRLETRSCDFANDVNPGKSSPGKKWQDFGCGHQWLDKAPFNKRPYRAPFAERIVLRRVGGECASGSPKAKKARAAWDLTGEGVKADAWLSKRFHKHNNHQRHGLNTEERLLRKMVTGASEARAKARASRRMPLRFGIKPKRHLPPPRKDRHGCYIGRETWCDAVSECVVGNYRCKVAMMQGKTGNIRLKVRKVKKKIVPKKPKKLPNTTLPKGFRFQELEVKAKLKHKLKTQAFKKYLKSKFGHKKQTGLGLTRKWNTKKAKVKKPKSDPRGAATAQEEKEDTPMNKIQLILKTKKLRQQAQKRAVSVAKQDLSNMLDQDIKKAKTQEKVQQQSDDEFEETIEHAEFLNTKA